MGRLLNEEQIISANIEKYLERAASEYTRFLETKPTFVTYFSKDMLSSTKDKGLENVVSNLGVDSPVMYNKIEHFPIYGIDTMSMSLNREDFGMNSQYEGDGTVIPGLIRPFSDDFFIFPFMGKQYLFRINNTSSDAIKSKPMYKIDFDLFKIVEGGEEVFANQIKSVFRVDFNNIGTTEKAVIKSEDADRLDYIEKISASLLQTYLQFFFNARFNIISFELGDQRFYNRHLNKFLIGNGILDKKYSFMDSYTLVEFMKEDISFTELYKNTIYWAMEKQDPRNLTGVSIFPMPITGRFTPFAHYSVSYAAINFVDYDIVDKTIPIFAESKLIQRIKLGQQFTDGKHIIENAIISFICDHTLPEGNLFLDTLNTKDWAQDLDTYMAVPLVLYILQQCKKKLLET